MPEGDTIFKAARALSSVLSGKRILLCDSPVREVSAGKLEGHTVTAVQSHGKNLLIVFDDGRALVTHLRMTGRWQIRSANAPPLRRTDALRLVLETETHRAACFGAPVVRLVTAGGILRDPALAALGPDLTRDDFDALEARRRLRGEATREIGDAIMLQRALAGVGNVYKSETLFLRKIDPFARVSSLDDRALDELVGEARRLLRRNLARGQRVTRRSIAGSRLWVYGRAGAACFVCGARIATRQQGAPPRTTYYCPMCQGVPPGRRP
jgi:endonuclease-8